MATALKTASAATQLRLLVFLQRQARCPDCGGPIVHGEGCASCPVCGYSHCGA